MYTSDRRDVRISSAGDPVGPAPAAAVTGASSASAGSAELRRTGDSTGTDLRLHLAVLRRRARLIAACALLSSAAAAAVTLSTTPMYAATTDLFVSAQAVDSDMANAYQGGLLSQQRVQSYARLVSSPAVVEEVVDRLGLPDDPAQLQRRITAEAPVNTVLISVSVSDEDPGRAKTLVDAVAAEFTSLTQRLEAPIGGEASPIRVRVVQPAIVPTVPVSPNVPRNIALGLALGLVLGIALAFVKNALDSTLKTVEDIELHVGATSLGVVARDAEAAVRPMISHDPPHSPRSEAFRHVRTNLQFVDVDNAPRSILVTSSSAAEGKSTTICNLAISLAGAGVRVCLVDADLRRPRLATYLGIDSTSGLTNVLAGSAPLSDVLQDGGVEGLSVLPSGPIPPNPAELLGSREMAQLLRTLHGRFDLVLVDSPPVLPVTDSSVLSRAVDGVVVVVRAGGPTRDQVERTLSSLRSVGGRVYGVVLVGADAGPREGYAYAPDVPAPRRRLRRERRAQGAV